VESKKNIFSILCFSMFYYDFSKIQPNKYLKEKDKTFIAKTLH